MKKDYYKILEIDRNASDEIIEKAYRTLAKKYHPDLQTGTSQKTYEEKLKEINEAYEVLSDEYKKSVYDEELKKSTISEEEVQRLINENRILKERLQQIEQVEQIKQMEEIQRVQNIQQMYKEYNPKVERRNYEINLKNKIKYYIRIAIAILILILGFLVIYQIPIVKNFCHTIYEENIFVKAIIDTFVKTFKAGF